MSVAVDLETAGGDVTIDMSSSAARGRMQCPPCFIVAKVHASRALILTNCHQSSGSGTAAFRCWLLDRCCASDFVDEC